MVVYDISAVATGATNVFCGFFPSKVVIYEENSTLDNKLEWNGAMGAANHMKTGLAAVIVNSAMITALADDDAASGGNGFVLASGILATTNFQNAYMEVYR